MAAGQERQEPETFAQEVQEGKKAAGRRVHTIRIKSNIDPEKHGFIMPGLIILASHQSRKKNTWNT